MLNNTQSQRAAIIGGLILIPNFLLAQIHLASTQVPSGPDPNISFDAIVIGHEGSSPLYACAVIPTLGYGVQLGNYRTGLPGCRFGFGGQEIYAYQFQFALFVSQWVNGSNGTLPLHPLVAGYTPQNTPTYYCRANVAGSDLQLGEIEPGNSGCTIPYGGSFYFASTYQVLTSDAPAYGHTPFTTVRATNGFVPPDAIRGGRDDDGTDLYVCTALVGGAQVPGKLRASFGGCDINLLFAETVVPTYEVLVPEWSENPPPPGYQYGFDYAPGYDIDGTPLYICRAYYQGNVMPGKTRKDWTTCNIGYNGAEVLATFYDIISELIPKP